MSVVKEMYQMTSINLTDALTEESSQEASVFDETELIGSPNTDMVAAQLASAGMSFSSFYHMMLCIAQTIVCPSSCLLVCLSQAGILWKQLHVSLSHRWPVAVYVRRVENPTN